MTQASDSQDPGTEAARPAPTGVIVLKRGKKKKKRKYSRGLKQPQIAGRRGLKAASRITRAISKGIELFRKRSNKSSRKKRDGMLRDLAVNAGRGAGRTLRVASKAPLNLARAFQGKGLRKPNRRVTKALGRLLRGLRIR